MQKVAVTSKYTIPIAKEGASIFKKLISWITQEPLVFSPKKMKAFLKSKGYNRDGINVYIIVGGGVWKFGIMSIYDDRLFFSENDLLQASFSVWEVPFKELISVDIRKDGSLLNGQKFLILKFRYEGNETEKSLAVAMMSNLANVPSNQTTDTRRTDKLYKTLSSIISKKNSH